MSKRWPELVWVSALSVLAGSGCYTKLAHRPVSVEGTVATVYHVDYRDDCSSCHRANPYGWPTVGPAFYDNVDLYAWQWYYQVPWWADAPFWGSEEGVGVPQSEARDFSRRHVAPPEASYGPPTVGAQAGMAPPVSKAATDSSQPETNALPPEPRRDFSRREADQAGERQRQPINAGQQTGQNKKKEQ